MNIFVFNMKIITDALGVGGNLLNSPLFLSGYSRDRNVPSTEGESEKAGTGGGTLIFFWEKLHGKEGWFLLFEIEVLG